MTSRSPRNKIVVYRLTQDEYESLKDTCAQRGARNLSEFTRSELLSAAQSDSLTGELEKRFSEVERRLSGVQDSVEQIANHLEIGAKSSPVKDE